VTFKELQKLIESQPDHSNDTRQLFILIDERDFMPKFQQDEVRSVSERYIAKSDPFIVMVSTPNAPGGLFQKIEQEPFDTCLYKKIFLDYTYGLDKIYTKAEIDIALIAKQSPSFPRVRTSISWAHRECLLTTIYRQCH
jgi:hypothetical protein